MDKGRSTGVGVLGSEFRSFDAATPSSGSSDETRIQRSDSLHMDERESPSHALTQRGALYTEPTPVTHVTRADSE